ncbi:MAG: response regulator [Acidobacteriota bacterium]|nr:MAG: response regulator [Acidobacteriota bacterium]
MSDRRHKILIVEDDQNLRLSLTELFRHLGYIVVTARDGDEGYMQAVAHQPDLIITDLNMPVLDGVELARLIRREHGKIGGIPIIALSANINGYHLPDKMTSGIDRFVDKSGGEGHHLITTVKSMLDPPSMTAAGGVVEHHAS